MKKFLKIFLGVLFAALLLGTFVFLWQKTRPVKVVYTIVQPKLDTLKQFVVATGKVEPRDEVLIKPQISGIVSDVYKEAGQMVRKGEVIATVKVVPEMGQLSSAESRVSVAEISLAQTRREFGRTETLHDKGVVSDEEFEQGRTDLQKAEEELQNAKENLEIVKNGITSRYKELSNTQIRSTIDGMILDVPIKVGNSVIQANTFNDGTTIASVADMSNMLFRGNVDETDVGKLHEGMPVKLTIGALQNVELDANLEYVSPKATEDNGVIMFEVKAAVKIPADVFVRAGYSANASIVIESREGVLTLPESTVEFECEKTYVYLLTSAEDIAEQTFDKREVKIGLSDGINIELTEGVTADDKVRGAKEDKKKYPQMHRSMKTSTLFAALCTAAAALCAMSAEAQTAPAAPQAAAAPAPGTPWSLDDCIGYALANNIDVQQRALQVEQNEVELSTAKYSRLPDLNASIGGDASFGRVLSSDNTYKDNNQTSGSLNISTSLPVFQGMRINRQVKGGKLDLAAAMQDLERAREDVSINVMTLYLEVLYNKELTDVAERQLALSTLQATQSRELVAAGKPPESARYESEALMAKDQLSLTQARIDILRSLLNLCQALNRESASGFDVVVPELDSVTLASLHRLGTADGVYNYAVENRPHIKAERLRLESSENSVLIAKSAL